MAARTSVLRFAAVITASILFAGLLLLEFSPKLWKRTVKTPVIALQPFGDVPDMYIQAVKEAISLLPGGVAVVLPEKPLPNAAWYEPRKRYRAEKLIEGLPEIRPPHASFIVGITTADISTRKFLVRDWGVFGLADSRVSACVISSFRLKNDNADEDLIADRLKKVALHEIGHLLGLSHCTTSDRCVMRASEGKVAMVDHTEAAFCERCRTMHTPQ